MKLILNLDKKSKNKNLFQKKIHDALRKKKNTRTNVNKESEVNKRKMEWIFTEQQIVEVFNKKQQSHHCTYETELYYRQKTAMFMLYVSRRLILTEHTLNIAVVYIHRFYMYNSFQAFSYKLMGPVCLFLAAKRDEKSLNIEQVIVESQRYFNQHLDLQQNRTLFNRITGDFLLYEEALLVCLNFDLDIILPHFHIIKACHLIRIDDELVKLITQLATCCLILTKFCLKYKANTIACICIQLFIKWGNWEIPSSSEGKSWHCYIDTSLNEQLLDELAMDFLEILHKTNSNFKEHFSILKKV